MIGRVFRHYRGWLVWQTSTNLARARRFAAPPSP